MLSQINSFKAIHSFEVKSSYIEIDSHSPENVFDSHIHNECEIYGTSDLICTTKEDQDMV